MSDCPQCGRKAGVTYSCRVPGCLGIRFCSPFCMMEHMGQHVKERDAEIERLRDDKQAVIDSNAFEVCNLKARIEELEEEAGYWKDKALGMAARFAEIGGEDE